MRYQRMIRDVALGIGLLTGLLAGACPDRGEASVDYSVQTVWSTGQYNAFTDLTEYNGRFYLTFRESTMHGIPPVGQPGGAIRVLESDEGQLWNSVAILSGNTDLRDPKLIVTPDNRLMLITGSTPQEYSDPNYSNPDNLRQTYAWFSSNGSTWSEPQTIGDPDFWLWDAEWHDNTCYGVSYGPCANPPTYLRFHASSDGVNFQTLNNPLLSLSGTSVSEAGLTFLSDDSAVMVVRQDGDDYTSYIGTSSGDYGSWNFVDSGVILKSPDLLQLPDGRVVAAGRCYDEHHNAYTGLCWLDAMAGTLTPFLQLPYGSDTGYPGMTWKNDKLWVSYYGLDDDQDIFVAQVNIVIPEPSTLTLLASAFVLAGGCRWRRGFRLVRSR